LDSHQGITKGIIIPFKPLLVGGSDFFVVNFCHFSKDIFKKQYYVANSLFFKKKNLRKPIKLFLPKIIKVAYKMKWCFKFYIFIFWILPNLAKYIYGLITIRTTSQNWKTKLWLGAWSTNSSSRSKFTLAFFTKKNR